MEQSHEAERSMQVVMILKVRRTGSKSSAAAHPLRDSCVLHEAACILCIAQGGDASPLQCSIMSDMVLKIAGLEQTAKLFCIVELL